MKYPYNIIYDALDAYYREDIIALLSDPCHYLDYKNIGCSKTIIVPLKIEVNHKQEHENE